MDTHRKILLQGRFAEVVVNTPRTLQEPGYMPINQETRDLQKTHGIKDITRTSNLLFHIVKAILDG